MGLARFNNGQQPYNPSAFDGGIQLAHFRIFDLDAPGARFEDIQKTASALQNCASLKARLPSMSHAISPVARPPSEKMMPAHPLSISLALFTLDLNNERSPRIARAPTPKVPRTHLFLHVGSFEWNVRQLRTRFRENDSNLRPRPQHPGLARAPQSLTRVGRLFIPRQRGTEATLCTSNLRLTCRSR